MGKITNIGQILRKYNSYKITREELFRLLKSEPFGRVTGNLGPFVLRYKNNKLIISRRAVVYNASKSRESVQNRNKFAAETRFASTLNRIPALKKIWAQADVIGVNGFHKLIRSNQIFNGYPSINNSITPHNHSIHIEQMCSLSKDLKINIDPNASLEHNEQLVIVIIPLAPYCASDKPFECISLCLSSLLPGSNPLLNTEQLQLCLKYKRYIMYSPLVNENEKVPQWSNTVCSEGKISFDEKMAGIVLIMWYLDLILKVYSGVQKQLWLVQNARDG